MVMISPTTLGLPYSGTVKPNEIVVACGCQEGNLGNIKTDGDGIVKWTGVIRVWYTFKYELSVKVYFPDPGEVGNNNELEMEIHPYNGGNAFNIYIFYTDSTHDHHAQYSGAWRTLIYDLDPGKVVDYVKFYNWETSFSTPGILEMDYIWVVYQE